MVMVIAFIKNNETGELRRCESPVILYDGHQSPDFSEWEDHGYCDCQRELLFADDALDVVGKLHCTEGRFSVNLQNPATGEVFYREFAMPLFGSN